MRKPSWPDLSGFDHLKIRASYILRDEGPFPFVIVGVALIAVLITPILVFSYRHAPITVALAPEGSVASGSSQIADNPEPPAEQAPEFINLQTVVDAWRKTTSANIGLMIYDLDNARVAASHQPDKSFNVASVYKLFFVYDGYRQIESGAVSANSRYVTTSDYRAGTYTYGECLDLAIRESYNGCADKLRSDKSAYTRVNALIKELSLKRTTNAGLSSTAADITELLKLYYAHSDLSDENWQKIADSMLNQPATKVSDDTTYDWRQGFPSGFSSQVNVYDKVGWAWDKAAETWTTYADAAIVEFPEENRHYIVVVLTSNLRGHDPVALKNLGMRLENAVLKADNKL